MKLHGESQALDAVWRPSTNCASKGIPVMDEDAARLSPLGHAHLNCLGRRSIAPSAPAEGLRELADIPPLPDSGDRLAGRDAGPGSSTDRALVHG